MKAMTKTTATATNPLVLGPVLRLALARLAAISLFRGH